VEANVNSVPKKMWCDWLSAAIIGVALFSLVLVGFPSLTQELFDWIAFLDNPPTPVKDPEVVKYLSFVYGVLGAVMLGWSVVLFYVVQGPFRAGEKWSWYAIAGSITVWFVVDSVHSVASGYWPNAVFNIGAFIAFGVPLVVSFTSFGPRSGRPD